MTDSTPSQSEQQFLTAEELERSLLEDIEGAKELPQQAVEHLVWLYSKTDRQQEASEWVRRLLASTDDQDIQAECLLRLGQLSEQMNDFDSAQAFYTQTVELKPNDTDSRYLAHNNLSYSLNQFGRYSEADSYCQTAIDLLPERHNAYKNLGVSLEGQRQYGLAAEYYIEAVRRRPTDPRAFVHLQDLWKEHPEIRRELPDIETKISECRAVVMKAQKVN